MEPRETDIDNQIYRLYERSVAALQLSVLDDAGRLLSEKSMDIILDAVKEAYRKRIHSEPWLANEVRSFLSSRRSREEKRVFYRGIMTTLVANGDIRREIENK